VSSLFFDDLARTYEFLTNRLSPIVLVGDANVRLDRPTDPSALRFNDLVESFALRQHVTGATHILGGTLDVVVTKSDDTPSSLIVTDVGLSDHYLVTWYVNMRRTSARTYVTSERRLWKNLDVASFRSALCSSALCTANLTAETLDADAMAAQYNQVMTTILDDLAPLKTTTYRVRQSDPWYNDECRSAKRSARKLEVAINVL